MYDGEVMYGILDEMANQAIMDKINPDDSEGRYKLLEHHIYRLRTEAIKIRSSHHFLNLRVNTTAFLERLSQHTDKKDRINFIWNHFIVKYFSTVDDKHKMSVLCFCIPMLVDCWDDKLEL